GERAGSLRAVLAAATVFIAAVALIAVAPGYGLLIAAALLLGCGFGAMNVALNAHGIALERLLGRPILSGLHAGFSLGGLSGAGVAALLAGGGIDVRVHLAPAAAVLGALLAAPPPG